MSKRKKCERAKLTVFDRQITFIVRVNNRKALSKDLGLRSVWVKRETLTPLVSVKPFSRVPTLFFANVLTELSSNTLSYSIRLFLFSHFLSFSFWPSPRLCHAHLKESTCAHNHSLLWSRWPGHTIKDFSSGYSIHSHKRNSILHLQISSRALPEW